MELSSVDGNSLQLHWGEINTTRNLILIVLMIQLCELVFFMNAAPCTNSELLVRKSASVQIIAHEPSRCEGCFDGRLPLLLIVVFIALVLFLLCIGVILDAEGELTTFSFYLPGWFPKQILNIIQICVNTESHRWCKGRRVIEDSFQKPLSKTFMTRNGSQ